MSSSTETRINSKQGNIFEYNSLETLRRRLLDLTGHNRLLNFRHPKAGSLRAIDELPDKLYSLLVNDRELTFNAVPEPKKHELIEAGYIKIDKSTKEEVQLKEYPNAEQWAKWLGLKTDYEVPEKNANKDIPAKHKDKKIQTLLYSEDLEAVLRSIRTKANSAIEETGTNILYMAFGFLQFYEQKPDQILRLAPLILVPVRLERGKLDRTTHTYNYTIQYTGEDILPNLSLKEKLRIDFGIYLPELGEDTTPESYFQILRNTLSHYYPEWRIRRYITLSLFNFAKLLMYLDLNPNKWPDNARIEDHPIIKQFFAYSDNETPQHADTFSNEHNIDQIPQIHEYYPLIDKADSSQHSALIDALDGKNLVVEGPPGTGKSQTITNLIAGALANGKKVLFVAEKMAALQVVKQRLDNSNLGDFCLELHSQKTQKRTFFSNLHQRLHHKKPDHHPERYQVDIERLQETKEKLNNYIKLIGQTWKSTGQSLHNILTGAVRYNLTLDIALTALHPTDMDANQLTPKEQSKLEDLVKGFVESRRNIIEQIGKECSFYDHPWVGIKNTHLHEFDAERGSEKLKDWQEKLSALLSELQHLEVDFGLKKGCLSTINGIPALIKDIEILEKPPDNKTLSVLPYLKTPEMRSEFDHYIDDFEKLYQNILWLSNYLTDGAITDEEAHSRLNENIDKLYALQIPSYKQLGSLQADRYKIEQLLDSLVKIKTIRDRIDQQLNVSLHDLLPLTYEGLSDLKAFCELAGKLPISVLKKRDKRFEDPELDELLPGLSVKVEKLKPLRNILQNSFKIDELPNVAQLRNIKECLDQGKYWGWLLPSWWAARNKLKSFCKDQTISIRSLRWKLPKLIELAEGWHSLQSNQKIKKTLAHLYQGLDTPVQELQQLRDWYRQIRESFGFAFGPKVQIGHTLINLDINVIQDLQLLSNQGLILKIEQLQQEWQSLQTSYPGYQSLYDRHAELSYVLENLDKTLEKRLFESESFLRSGNINIGMLKHVVDSLTSFKKHQADWFERHGSAVYNCSPIKLVPFPACNNDHSLQLAKQLRNFSQKVVNISIDSLRELVFSHPNSTQGVDIQPRIIRLHGILSQVERAKSYFVEWGQVDLKLWCRKAQNQLNKLIERNSEALEKPEWLGDWLDYLRQSQFLINAGYQNLVEAVEQGHLLEDSALSGFWGGTLDLLARQAFNELPELTEFNGKYLDTCKKRFKEYDDHLADLQQLKIAYELFMQTGPEGHLAPRRADCTEMTLVRHECNKKQRHLPIRQVIAQATQSIQALKPCFMMSPLSIAQYLPRGAIHFDLLIMDEASQVKPEDAIGAIARSEQVVIVGDPKQLPPTSFFERNIEEELDPTTIEVSESILEATRHLFKSRRLRWHYRSRHQSLIAFSNEHFYDGDLVVFPSPYAESDDYGITFTPVKRGCFINSRNDEEAEIVVKAIANHLVYRPEVSLGVVAMNAPQANCIERELEKLVKDNAELEVAYEKNINSNEPLFIKNLENVQGDERDIIYISMTYGPSAVGSNHIPHRFGPITNTDGWRRLNVLITRAKQKINVFSSMRAEHIRTGNSSSKGLCALKEFIAYAEKGDLSQRQEVGQHTDNHFEAAVMHRLKQAGYECDPHLGVAGFFIDIAVRDPGQSGCYLAGIECDGATHHLTQSVRDRDCLRQSILENLGWTIFRIWSTDWFRNPESAMQPVLNVLEELKTQKSIAESLNESTQIGIIEDQEAKTSEVVSNNYPPEEESSLKDKLKNFDSSVVRPGLPDTPPEQRLLRPAMLEAFCEYEPTSRREFVEYIPHYLREATATAEARYLDQVFEIISESC